MCQKIGGGTQRELEIHMVVGFGNEFLRGVQRQVAQGGESKCSAARR